MSAVALMVSAITSVMFCNTINVSATAFFKVIADKLILIADMIEIIENMLIVIADTTIMITSIPKVIADTQKVKRDTMKMIAYRENDTIYSS